MTLLHKSERPPCQGDKRTEAELSDTGLAIPRDARLFRLASNFSRFRGSRPSTVAFGDSGKRCRASRAARPTPVLYLPGLRRRVVFRVRLVRPWPG